MFSKLINAVLVFGLFLTLCGTALSIDTGLSRETDKIQIINQSTSVNLHPNPSLVAPLQRPAIDYGTPKGPFQVPALSSPKGTDTTASYCQLYYDDDGTTYYIGFTTPGNSNRDKAMRFDIPESHNATIWGAYVGIDEASADYGGLTLELTVYTDAGGLPGTIVYQETYPLGEIVADPDGFQVFWFGFTTPPTLTDQSYHVGVDFLGDPQDIAYMVSDDGGPAGPYAPYGATATPTGRGSRKLAADGLWYSNMAYQGWDPNYFIAPCQDVWYTSCYYLRGVPPGYVNFWGIPDDGVNVNLGYPWPNGGILNGFGQRFVSEGRDSLWRVRLDHFDYTGYGWEHYPLGSTNGLIMEIWPDDGSGNIDYSGVPLKTVNLPGGDANRWNLFPQTGGQGAGWNTIYIPITPVMIMEGAYHVTFRTDGNDWTAGVFLLSLNVPSTGANYTPAEGGSLNFTVAPWTRTGLSPDWLSDGGGEEQGVGMRVYLCRDEFYNCFYWKFYNDPVDLGYAYAYTQSTTSNNIAIAQKKKAITINRIEKVRAMITTASGYPAPVTSVLRINIYEDGGISYDGAAAPGAVLYSQDVAAPMNMYPAFNEIVIPGGFQKVGSFYVGYQGNFIDPTERWRVIDEQNTGLPSDAKDGGAIYFHRAVMDWLNCGNYWGSWENIYAEVDYCSTPLVERACAAGDQWPAMANNFGRSNASLSSLGEDPKGKLTKIWEYVSPVPGNLNSPAIWYDTVVNYFLNHIVAINIADGTEIWNRTADGFEIGSGCYSTPTIYNFAAFGEDVTLVFTGGGDTKAINCLNLTDGTTRWTRSSAYHSFDGFLTYGPTVILDIDGEPVLFYGLDNGKVFACNALTGVNYAGWGATPWRSFGGRITKGLVTDGTYLWVGVMDNLTNGDVVKVDAPSGTEMKRLSAEGGLQGLILSPDNGPTESFSGGISYEMYNGVPTLFTASDFDQYSDYPPQLSGGIQYALQADNLALKWAKTAVEQQYMGNAVDANNVINNGWNGWLSVGEFRGPVAFKKSNGAVVWSNTATNPGLGPQNLVDGILSCETGAPDWYIAGNDADFLDFFDADDGRQMFYRRFSGGQEFAHHYSPAMCDGYFLFCYYDQLICLTTAEDPRPRLDIPQYAMNVPVEFGSPDHTPVRFENALGNIGGADLTVLGITLSDTSNNTTPAAVARLSVVDYERVTSMEQIASKFAGNAAQFRNDIIDVTDVTRNARRNNAAYALPSWIYGLTEPLPGTIIAAASGYGDSSGYVDIVLDIDGSQVPRGFTGVYAWIDTDDPDYFLDSAMLDDGPYYAIPQILLGIVGGCLYDSVQVTFGATQQNSAWIYNATKIATGPASGSEWEIDGDNTAFFQGDIVFSTARISNTIPAGKAAPMWTPRTALHGSNWHNDPLDWESILPDPNCYDQTCDPSYRTNVIIGEISNDNGANFEDVYGEIVCFAFIDSVADMCIYDTMGVCDWDWGYARATHEGIKPPLRDSLTMGFHGCGSAFMAYDQPLLNNFVIFKYDFSGRYGPVNNVWMGAMIDYDINYPADNKNQYTGYDAAHSLGYAYTRIQQVVGWGVVKIPWGCGYTPLVNAKTCSAQQAVWNDSDIWLDSVYYWMSQVTGLTHQRNADPAQQLPDADDREAFFTFAELDMPAAPGTLTIGFANFGLPGITNSSDASNYFEIANISNKWAGFGRGDVNNDNKIDLVDVAYIIEIVKCEGNPSYPFRYLSDVNCDGDTDQLDEAYMLDYYFNNGDAPLGQWELGCSD